MIRKLFAALFAMALALPALAADALSEGIIKKLDAAKGSVTIAHGPLPNLGMGAMTMSFKADPATLGKLKAGDKVRFLAEEKNGALLASHIEAVK